ncbi:MAG: hypothetical protein JNK14_05205 [Chitinophagaceae bacterium]|nr:hypothetical protein [Chitinophagaceae bacterium]
MRILFAIIFSLSLSASFAQQASYFDPAQAYNRLLIEKNSGTYRQVSNFKVTGTAYLFGEKNNGAIYTPNETGKDIFITYDTYTQHVIFYPSANGPALTKEPGSVDSFIINKNPEAMLDHDILFVYGSTLGVKDKVYFQAIARGKKANLYKKYTSELGVVSTNYIQSELRQFNINVDYYYADSTGKGLKKLKISSKNITKEFAGIKDLSGIINEDDLTANRENELTRLFGEMNKE